MRKNTSLKHIQSDGLRDPYRAFHPKTEHTFLRAHGTFSRINNTLGHNLLNEDGNHIKHFCQLQGYETKDYKKIGKSKNIWKLNSILLNNYEVRVKDNIEENENTTYQNLPDAARAVLKGKSIIINT